MLTLLLALSTSFRPACSSTSPLRILARSLSTTSAAVTEICPARTFPLSAEVPVAISLSWPDTLTVPVATTVTSPAAVLVEDVLIAPPPSTSALRTCTLMEPDLPVARATAEDWIKPAPATVSVPVAIEIPLALSDPRVEVCIKRRNHRPRRIPWLVCRPPPAARRNQSCRTGPKPPLSTTSCPLRITTDPPGPGNPNSDPPAVHGAVLRYPHNAKAGKR